jgi:quercetin dioxygenase-like cupin family protein
MIEGRSALRRAAGLERERSLKKTLVVLGLMGSALAFAQEASVSPLVSKDLVGVAGKEATLITVNFAPGASSPIHRHNAQVFVYMLEGTVIMQVRGQQQVTLHPGQTFYEGPDDVHTVGRNASTKEPAKFLVFIVKDKGSPISIPEK